MGKIVTANLTAHVASDVFLNKGDEWDSDDPFVKDHPQFFDFPAEPEHESHEHVAASKVEPEHESHEHVAASKPAPRRGRPPKGSK